MCVYLYLRGNGTYLAICTLFFFAFLSLFPLCQSKNKDKNSFGGYDRVSYSLHVRYFLPKLTLSRHATNYQCFANYFGHFIMSDLLKCRRSISLYIKYTHISRIIKSH